MKDKCVLASERILTLLRRIITFEHDQISWDADALTERRRCLIVLASSIATSTRDFLRYAFDYVAAVTFRLTRQRG